MKPLRRQWLIVFIIFIMAGTGALFAQRWDQDKVVEMHRKAERRYLPRNTQLPVYRYYDYMTVEAGERIDAHVVIIDGDLNIKGHVSGSVLAVGGDVVIDDGARVAGNVTSVGGSIDLQGDGEVSGNMLETQRDFISRRNRAYRYEWNSRSGREHWPKYHDSNDWYRSLEPDENNFLLRYNRVEGSVIGFQVPREYHRRVYLTPYGSISYGFESGDLRYQLGLDRAILRSAGAQTVVGAEVHDLTDTKDLWRVDYFENSLAAFFWKQDYHDYYRRRGYSLNLTQFILPSVRATLQYRNDTYKSLSSTTGWSVFRSKGDFRPNPLLGDDAGEMRSFLAALRLDTRNRQDYPSRGVLAEFSGEISQPSFGGDFDFRRYLLTLEWLQPLSYGENLMFRVIAGTSSGALPLQKNFELGGVGSLRGFPYKAFSGTRMFMTTVEYRLMPDLLDDWFNIDGWQLILFGDAGDVWSSDPADDVVESFRPLNLGRLHSSIGIGVGEKDGTFRLDIAKRTDRDASAIVMLRIRQPF